MAKKPKAEAREIEVHKATPSRTLSPFEEMDRMFESFFPRGWMRPLRWEWPELAGGLEMKMPRVDIVDREDEVLVRAEIPGVKKEDLDVSLTENSVTIKGKTSHEQKEEKGEYYRCEISRGAFSRTVALPGEVNADKAKAAFKDGVLELTLPKQARSKRRTITVE